MPARTIDPVPGHTSTAATTTTLLHAHDLLWIPETSVATDGVPLPDWTITACRQGAPIVVRCAPRGTDGSMSVGLRGGARHERCAATAAANRITRVVSSEALAAQAISIAHDAPFAALCTLRALAPGPNALDWAWGPTGGAGFALTSDLPVLHADSDLDLVVYMPRAPSTVQRDQLIRLFSSTECRVDLQTDTGCGGFALRDWLTSPRQALFKTDHGPRLVADPWNDAA